MADPQQAHCRAPWDGAVVHWSGAVYPCDQMSRDERAESTRLGWLTGPDAQSLDQILDGEPARQLRRALATGDLDGLLCQTCDKAGTCNLYGDPVGGAEAGPLHGGAGARLAEAPDAWPLARLELGLTDTCSMRCTMCALSRGEPSPVGVPTGGMMPVWLVRHCLDAAVRRSTAPVHLLLHWIGEPLLHPELAAVLDLIERHGPAVRLHLVTNGIGLTAEVTQRLLALPGPHTLNVSLNAWSNQLFAKVNRSTQRDRVYAHTRHFLAERQARARQDWALIASAVVCHDDTADVVAFVDYWRAELAEHGLEAELVLNGKAATSAGQIMLLCEADDPRSQARFRAALRALDHRDASWPLHTHRHLDAVAVGGAWSSAALDELAALHATDAVRAAAAVIGSHHSPATVHEVLAHIAPRLAAAAPATVHRAWSVVRTLAFDHHLRLTEAVPLRHSDGVPGRLAAALWLMGPQPSPAWARVALAHASEAAVVMDLAAALALRPELARSLPTPLPALARTPDLSGVILQLSAGRLPASLALDVPEWQLEAAASLLGGIDGDHVEATVTGELGRPTSVAPALLAMCDPRRVGPALEHALAALGSTPTPPGRIRTLRRRWLAAGRHLDQAPVGDGLVRSIPDDAGEAALLVLALSSGQAAIGHFDALVGAWIEHGGPGPLSWQDLAEVVVRRPGMLHVLARGSTRLDALVEALADGTVARCPSSALGALQLVHELRPDRRARAREGVEAAITTGLGELEAWQQAQWRALSG